MTEEFLSFLWRHRLYKSDKLRLDDERVEVIHPGELNRDSGPDFFNTKLKIGETIWAGNAEVHLKASDWNLHNHDKNAAFDNVVLHITAENDQPVFTSKGRRVATVKLDFNHLHLNKYLALMANQKWIPCAGSIGETEAVVTSSWLSKLGIERLENRTRQIAADLDKTANNWEEVFYWQMARSYGFHLNAQPFEALARSVPYHLVKKHGHTPFQLEAIFFGQAGFLHNNYSNDEYYNSLQKEYNFLRLKYNLQPIDTHLWKFMRLRPGNFPTIRIAQFVALFSKNTFVFSAMLEADGTESICNLLAVEPSDYWKDHYTFGNVSQKHCKIMGWESIKILIINTIVPFYFTYGRQQGLVPYQDKALKLLENLQAEFNSVIREWIKLGLKPETAFDSQALIQLKNEYCDRKRCLECGIGLKIIANA